MAVDPKAPWLSYQSNAQPETAGNAQDAPWEAYRTASQGRMAAADESAPGQVQMVDLPASTSAQPDYTPQDRPAETATSERGAFTRGLEDALLFGGGKKVNALVGATADALSGNGFDFSKRYAGQEALERGDARHDDVMARQTGNALGLVPTMLLPAGELAEGAGLGARLLRQALVGGGYGAIGGVASSKPGDELTGAAEGTAIGAGVGTTLPAVVGSGARIARRVAARYGTFGTDTERAINALGIRTPQDANAVAQETMRQRELGANPTLTDVVDRNALGVIRDAGDRPNTRDTADRYYRRTRQELPDRMQQISQTIDPTAAQSRPVHEVIGDIEDRRGALANSQYSEVRPQPVQMSPEARDVLTSDEGRSAIRQARRLQPAGSEARQQLDDLLSWANNPRTAGTPADPLPPGFDGMSPRAQAQMRQQLGLRDAVPPQDREAPAYTVDHADRISDILLGVGQNATQSGKGRLGSVLTGMGQTVRREAAAQHPGYAEALENYGNQSTLRNAAQLGEGIRGGNADEFVTAARGTSRDPVQVPVVNNDGTVARARDGSYVMEEGPSPNAVARQAARRALDLEAGNGPRRALGLASDLADNGNMLNRLSALTDHATGQRVQQQAEQAAESVRRAAQTAPSTGSQTFSRNADRTEADLINFGLNAKTGGGWGLARSVGRFLAAQRIGNVNAGHLVELATNPNRLDEAIEVLRRQGVGDRKAARIVRSISAYGRNAAVENTGELDQ